MFDERLERERAELLRQRAAITAQLDLIDRLAGDDGGKDEPEEPPAPKAGKPARTPAPVGGGMAVGGFSHRVATALLGGPLTVAGVEKQAGVSYPTAAKVLKGNPQWFTKGAGRFDPWGITDAGRDALRSLSSEGS